MNHWDSRFLGLAQYVAQWSKDPSTKTGAVITDSDRRVVSLGYNGFPKGIHDTQDRLEDREIKYKLMVHCERNAIISATRSLKGCTLYIWPFGSCAPCAAMVIQVGITRVCFPFAPKDKLDRWAEDFKWADTLFTEAGVEISIV